MQRDAGYAAGTCFFSRAALGSSWHPVAILAPYRGTESRRGS